MKVRWCSFAELPVGSTFSLPYWKREGEGFFFYFVKLEHKPYCRFNASELDAPLNEQSNYTGWLEIGEFTWVAHCF